MMEDKNITFNMNGGQLNYARDNGTIYATQNNGDNTNSLDIILKEIRAQSEQIKKLCYFDSSNTYDCKSS